MADTRIPERLFRDDAGAAFERAARLEDENKQLRAEVERLRSVGPRPVFAPRPCAAAGGPLRSAIVALSVAAAVLGSSAVAFSARHHRHHHRPVRAVPAVHAIDVTSTEGEPTLVDTHDATCNPPYRVDAHGRKRYKIECLDPR